MGPTQPTVQYESGALFPRVKRSRIEAGHSPSTVDVRMRGFGPPLLRIYFIFVFVKRCPYRGLFNMLVSGANDICCWGYRCRPVRFV